MMMRAADAYTQLQSTGRRVRDESRREKEEYAQGSVGLSGKLKNALHLLSRSHFVLLYPWCGIKKPYPIRENSLFPLSFSFSLFIE